MRSSQSAVHLKGQMIDWTCQCKNLVQHRKIKKRCLKTVRGAHHNGKDLPLKKRSTSLESHFLPNRIDNLPSNIEPGVLFIHRLIPRKHGFLGGIADFDTTPICRSFKPFCSVPGLMGHKSACFLVSVGMYVLCCAACEIWRWLIYLNSEKKATRKKIVAQIFEFLKAAEKSSVGVPSSSPGHETAQMPSKSQVWGLQDGLKAA
jgi:hypothetical protein